jgi:hypothetical protein
MLYGESRMPEGSNVRGSRTVFVMEMPSDGTVPELIGSGIDPITRSYLTNDDGTADGTFMYPVDHWHMLAYNSTKTTLHLTTARSIRDQGLTIDFTNNIDFEVIDAALLNSSGQFIGFNQSGGATAADPVFYTGAQLLSVSVKGESVVLAIAFDIDGKIAINSSEAVSKLVTNADIRADVLTMSADMLIKFNVASQNASDQLNGTTLLLGNPIPVGFQVDYDLVF